MKRGIYLYAAFLALLACSNNDDLPGTGSESGQGNKTIQLGTDKACYAPGETVTFTVDKAVSGQVMVRYRHLNTIINEEAAGATTWTWTPPAENFKGYMVDVYEVNGEKEKILGSIAVDVSSDWKRFPRYGFLSHYDKMESSEMEKVMANLNRHHINGVQFQDFHYKHHKPLAGTPESPAANWTDIANRNVEKQTVDKYLATIRQYGMKSMYYNLCFGALKDAAQDGVQEEWYIFKDRNHTQKDNHALPSNWKSDIYLVNPIRAEWQSYLARQNDDLYKVYNFDGYQIDQLGGRGSVYDYSGNAVNLPQGYLSFIHAMKQAHPTKRLVMNAVSEFGQEQIAQGEVDFFYNEVWGDTPKMTDLVRILEANKGFNPDLQTVFAAYMNYNVADGKGYFNTPGVLLTDAIMFAFGGSHLELGEHMLGKEYFPNNNLEMKPDLKTALISYYDFLVAYQNLLRDGGAFNSVELSCSNGKMEIAAWPPQSGKVASVGKLVDGNKQVMHLINLSKANNFDWRDIDGSQPEPTIISKAGLKFRTTKPVKKVWAASPDYNSGVAEELEFTQNAVNVTFRLPSMKYWAMIVVEYN